MTTPDWLHSITFNADGLIPAIAQDHDSGRILMMAWMNSEALELTAQTQTAVYFSRSRSKLWHKGETSGHTQHVHEIRLDCDADVIVLSVTQVGGIACHTGRESCFYQRLDLSGDTPRWETVDAVIKDPAAIYDTVDANNSAQSTADADVMTPADSQAGLNAPGTPTRASILQQLDQVLADRKQADADSSYVASLYAKGINKILEKVGEEATESIIAAKDLAACSETHSAAFVDARDELIYEVADVWFHTLVGLAYFDIDSKAVTDELARRFGLSGIEEKAARNAS